MALYSKRQFAELIDIPSKDLSNYIKRGKVVLKDGVKCACAKNKCTCLIDDTDEINQLFLSNREIQPPKPQPEPKKKEVDVQEKSAEVKFTAPRSIIQRGKVSNMNVLVEEREIKKNQKIDLEMELTKAKLAKLSEEMIPKDVVVHLIVAQSEGVKSAFNRAADTFITLFGAENQMTREKIVYWRMHLTDTINEAVVNGVKESKANLRKIAKEYAGKKDRGERDDL